MIDVKLPVIALTHERIGAYLAERKLGCERGSTAMEQTTQPDRRVGGPLYKLRYPNSFFSLNLINVEYAQAGQRFSFARSAFSSPNVCM
jgi:hypothetical protein